MTDVSPANLSAGFTQELQQCRDTAVVGGKAANLGRLVRAGFSVPDGFVVTTSAYLYARDAGSPANGANGSNGSHEPNGSLPADLVEQIIGAYAAMGRGSVAVRSSATAEDMAAASMAGQYETFLDVVGDAALLDAIRCCWASLDSPRIRTYLAEHGIDRAQVAMAVLVQKLVSADVAGVLFTANPQTGTRREMLVEASWGLGESVVSGRVQPDVLRVDRETGRVLAATIADKRVFIPPGAHEERPVEEHRRRLPCLRSADVARLWQLGRKAAEHFGGEQDIEWAIHRGELFLLQSRPITTLEEAETYEEVLRSTRACLREKLAAGQGPWVLHNLAETLPHPTPLTWSVISRFMSGDGGFGAMYRLAGFEPAPAVARDGFLERVAGKVYMDASRAAEMFFENYPFAYEEQVLRDSPDAGQAPPSVPKGTIRERMRIGKRLAQVNDRLRKDAADFDQRLSRDIIPAFIEWCAAEKSRDLGALSTEELIELWHERQRRVLEEFAPQSLLPSLISGMALAELRTTLDESLWDEDPDALSQLLSSGGEADATVRADAELYEVGHGRRTMAQWLADHGHRASGEFDLASPRWREQPEQVATTAARLKEGIDPLDRHRQNAARIAQRIEELRAALGTTERAEFDERLRLVRRYVPFREGGKDVLMLGYDLLRDLALEAGRRLEIAGDVFFLTLEDLFDALRVGFAPLHLIAQRKQAHRAEARVSVPRLIDAAGIETIGEPPEVRAEESAGGYKAFALSSGAATGPARIVHSPIDAPDLGKGYILVCPSTDPSWTPLFVNAAGLVLECGGTLSHGAVVAREMGLPAVVLPDATRIFPDGERIRVDGRRGTVGRAVETSTESNATSEAGPAPASNDPADTAVPREWTPPPPGARERSAARVRNVTAIFWTVYLAAAFLLPEQWVYQPSIRVLDFFLWPLVRGVGRVMTVVLIAGGLAILTMVIQRFWTDNARLREAKRRAALLSHEAGKFAAGSPRRAALSRLAAPVQWRVVMAAFLPLGVLLGPMVMSFSWLHDRMEPANWNAPPGSDVSVVATVADDLRSPVTVTVAPPLALDETSPPSWSPPPVRETLDRLLKKLRQPADDPTDARSLADEWARRAQADDLEAYLNAHVPQTGTWKIRAPEGAAGRFPINIAAGKGRPVQVDVVLGDTHAPAPAEVQGPSHSPVKTVKVIYPPPAQQHVFWAPFAHFGHPWDAGWLSVYLLAYLPAMFATRAILKVA